MKCLTRFFAKIDLFGAKQSFRIKNKEDYGSSLGGFCFMLYGILAVLFLLYSTKVFIGKETFAVMVIDKAFSPAKRLNFTENDFSIAMRLSYMNGTSVQNSMYKDLFKTEAKKISKKNGHAVGKELFSLKNCEKEDFKTVNDSNLFKANPMNEYTCFGNKNDMVLEGSETEEHGIQFDIQISLNEKYLADYEKLKQIFSDNIFKFYFYYTQPMYDLSNKEKPVFQKLSSFYTFLDLTQYKLNEVTFQEFIFSDDSSLLLEKYENQSNLKFESNVYHASTVLDRTNPKSLGRLNLAKYKLMASSSQTTVKRSYKKLGDFIAGLLAILTNCLVCLGIVISLYNERKARQSIIKRVMRYNDDLAEDEETQKELKELQKDFYDENKKIPPAKKNEDGLKIEVSNYDDGQALLPQADSDKKKAKHKYTLTFCDFLTSMLGCHKEKKEIFVKAEQKVFYNTDILTYMKSVQELEILKYMLLDEKMIKVMNFISKPGVSYIDRGLKSPNPFFYDPNSLKVEPNMIDELHEIKVIYADIKNKKDISPGEKKILDLFESQINEIVNPEQK